MNQIQAKFERRLPLWMSDLLRDHGTFVQRFDELGPMDLVEEICASSAARHPWYDYLQNYASLAIFANFLAEEATMPPFIPMLQRCQEVVTSEAGKAAIARNIRDEYHPTPHFVLFQRTFDAVTALCPGTPTCDLLLDQVNATYDYGMENAYFMIGVLSATELMVPRRASNMRAGLLRLGLHEKDVEFMTIHAQCDQEHASEWFEFVLQPMISESASIRRDILDGIVVRLLTSQRYLDRLYMGAIQCF